MFKLKIPAIRLRNNFDYEPYLELKVDGEKKYCEPLAIKGSGILMQTKSMGILILQILLVIILILK